MASRKTVTEPNLARLLSAVEPMKREAYIQGWRDAIAAVTRAAGTLLLPPEEAERQAAGKHPTAAPAAGSNLDRVLTVVRTNPGLKGVEMIKVTHQAGYDIGSESIRTCLHRLAKRGLIENLDGKWFPVTQATSQDQPQ